MTLTLAVILLLSFLPLVSQSHLEERKDLSNEIKLSKSYRIGGNSTFIRTIGIPQISTASWEHNITSTHFSVHSNTTGSHATSHEYAQNISNALEYSWTTEVTNLGFNEPPDSHMNVYLKDLLDDLGVIDCYWSPSIGWHVANITIDIDMNPGLANVTCAHEFFHTIQLSYLPDAPDTFEDDWIAEGTATWIMSKVYPEYIGYGSYIDWVNDYIGNPDRLITELSYPAVLYWIFLEEHYGGISTVENVLQQTTSKDGIFAVNATLNSKGTTFTDVFEEWTIANYLKNSSYSNGELFDQIALSVPHFTYEGTDRLFHPDVSDWGADYFEVSSSVIYMPIQFIGEESQSVTKIFIEHGVAIVSGFELSATYEGTFFLMQANNLDKVVVIVRSLGNETSTDRVSYYLNYLGSSYILAGPYQLTSSMTTIAVIETIVTHFTSTLTLTAVMRAPSQDSSTSTILTVNGSSTQTCSPKSTTVVNKSSSQSSSETPLNVTWTHDVAVTSIRASPTTVPQGQPIYINATVENHGDFTETFDVIVYADQWGTNAHFEIGNETVSLDIEESTLLEFVWDTTGVPYGTYWITAEAILPEDAVPQDNIARTKVGGICVPYSPSTVDIIGLLMPIASVILAVVLLGAAVFGLFKILMSVRLRWPWRWLKRMPQARP